MKIIGRRAPPAPDAAVIRTLAGLLAETGLTEIEYAVGDHRIRVAREHASSSALMVNGHAPSPPVHAGYTVSASATALASTASSCSQLSPKSYFVSGRVPGLHQVTDPELALVQRLEFGVQVCGSVFAALDPEHV